MAGRIRMSVEVHGHRELMRKLRSDELLAEPWQHAMEQVKAIGLAAAQARAPVGRGMLKSKLTSKMQARPIPRWAVVKTTATRSSAKYRRYRYPARLEFDPKSRHRDWLINAIRGAWGRIQGALNGAAREIESRWGR